MGRDRKIEKDREISPSGVSSLAAVGVVAPPPRMVARRDEAPGKKKGLLIIFLWRTQVELHCQKRLSIFPSPAGMSLTKLSLAGKNLIVPGLGVFGK